ncbi:MAG: TonB-dependent receptor, partial [Gemmatimonadetes bacterium]|nr:TonB-dependent receptor [Gemmatimonadota bacterium]
MRRFLTVCLSLAAASLLGAAALQAQGVTTSLMNGVVYDANGAPLAGANIIAVHQPSATRYGAVTRSDGRFVIPGMRVGGPYQVTVSLIGFADQVESGLTLTLGVATNLVFRLASQALNVEGITVTATRDPIISSDRTGAAATVDRQAIEVLPTINRRLESFARLTPQYGSGFSFAGQDNRLNNITVDGSYFNNSFGLGGQPGDRTGVAPISMDAIEQIQINVAPFDVRQGNFVGAGVNTVTRSGGNEFKGSLYHQFRDNGLVGKKAGDADVLVGNFDYSQWGGWLSGPILKDKLFFFASYEEDALVEPGTTFRANTGSETVGGSITRVKASDLDALSTFLKDNFGYVTGPYQGYDHEVPAKRFLGKLDYNFSDKNKVSVRYTFLDSNTDVLLSNSSSLGFGTRRTNTTGLNFQNSNYQIMENIRSMVGEWNSIIGQGMANNLIVGYTTQDESRNSRGEMFPFVDVLSSGSVYTSFGFEPFTPNNELRYNSFQLQDNFSVFREGHTLTFGASFEKYHSENVFYSGKQSVYVYNSLDDFYTDARDYKANPSRTTSPVTLNKFQVRWTNIPGQEKPIQPLDVYFAGVYAQDEWQANPDLKVTLGLRVD